MQEEINLKILDKKITISDLQKMEEYFDYMSKAVVDIEKGIIAVDAELHSDIEELLLENGSNQKMLYGINIVFGESDIEFDSMINPPRNREAGFPRAGREIADPKIRERIKEIVHKWIEM